MKKTMNINLATVDVVKKFVNLTAKIDGDIALISGRWVIDGKSIMGIFSLDLSKDLICEIEASEEQVTIFENELKKLAIIQ